MSAYLGITGTPGTGKKTLAPLVAGMLGVPAFGLNEFSAGSSPEPPGGERAVAADRLGKEVLSSVRGPCLIYGHLLPYAFGRGTFSSVAVLRCDPTVLRRRLEARGYGEEKVRENVEAELIGVLAADSVSAFGPGRVNEIDTTKGAPPEAASVVAACLRRGGTRKTRIDWMDSYGSAARLRSLLGSRTPSPRT
jgi:adenylate kinase